MPVMIETVNGIAQANPDRKIILMGCGDNYVALAAQAQDAGQLASNVIAPMRPTACSSSARRRRSSTSCARSTVCPIRTRLPLPCDAQRPGEASAEVLDQIDFPFPMILKPSDGIMWWEHEFEGQKKAYEIADRAELEQVIRDVYASGYTDDLILQDRVPGNDEYMRVLTSYSDRNGKVRMMCLGHVLLEEHQPWCRQPRLHHHRAQRRAHGWRAQAA